MIGNSDNETNVPHKLLLTNKQVASIFTILANYLSADIKLTKIQLFKIAQSGEFLGRFLGPLLKIGLPVTKNVLQPIGKVVLISFGLVAASASRRRHARRKSYARELRH